MQQEENTHQLKKWQIWLPLMLSGAIVLGMLAGTQLHEPQPRLLIEPDESGKAMPFIGYGRMEELVRYIDAKYVDDVKGDELVKEAIEYLLGRLDPHSTFIPKEELQEVNEQLQGNFDGIGIEFMLLDDTIVVVTPLAGGPSEAAGIMAGDKIIMIGDSTLAGKGLSSDDVVNYLRGDPGSEITLKILRPSERKIRLFKVKRDKIPTHSVDVAYMLDEKTGYFKVNRFSANTYTEFMQELEKLVEKEGMKNLVLDLRQNPGGYLQEATKLLSQLFAERDKLLVYTEGRSVRRTDYETTGRNFFDIDKIAVLIDEGSASASEIVAGAIQDWDRGVIVGRRSFGKGLVQEQYKLSDGSALRLTVARYYTPSGRCIQREYKNEEDYDGDLVHRFESGELEDESKFSNHDTTKYYTAGGRVVFGGGGIMPDIFVPIDTVLFSEYFLTLRQQIPPFIFRYYEENKTAFAEMSQKQFENKFQINDQLFYDFLNYAESKGGVKRNNRQLSKVESLIKKNLKARLARHIYGDTAFYEVINDNDPVIEEALQSILKNKPLVQKND